VKFTLFVSVLALTLASPSLRADQKHCAEAMSTQQNTISRGYSPDGSLYAEISETHGDTQLRVFMAKTGLLYKTLEIPDVNIVGYWGDGGKRLAAGYYPTFSPDGKRLALISEEQDLLIWDVKYGDLIQHFRGPFAKRGGIAWSPNSQFILTRTNVVALGIMFADVTTGKWTHEAFPNGNMDLLWLPQWSPDGKHILADYLDRSNQFKRAEENKKLRDEYRNKSVIPRYFVARVWNVKTKRHYDRRTRSGNWGDNKDYLDDRFFTHYGTPIVYQYSEWVDNNTVRIDNRNSSKRWAFKSR